MSDNNADFDLWWEDNEEKVTMDFKRIIEEEMPSYKAELLNNEYADYSEIKLHYTQPHNYTDENGDKINHAWRTITWDLFDEFVTKE